MFAPLLAAAAAAGTAADNTNLYIGVLGVVAAALTAFAVIYKARHNDDLDDSSRQRSQSWQNGDMDRRINDIGRRDDEQDRRMGSIEETARRLDDRVEQNRRRIDAHLDGLDGKHGHEPDPRRGDVPYGR